MKPTTRAKRKSSTSVPGQALGYYLQETKMVELLARAERESEVSLEVLDDLAVQSADGNISLYQSKSALTSNPVSDRAIPLWKTLSNWAEELPSGTDFSKLSLVISVSNPRTGGIAETLHSATTEEQAVKALTEAEITFSAELASADSKTKDLNFFLKRFFRSDTSLKVQIVRCFRLETNIASPHEDLPSSFPFIPSNNLEDVIHHALGWVKRRAELLLEQKKPAIISRDDFHKEMTSYIQKRRERSILRSIAPATVPHNTKAELMPRLFVRQLEAIDADFNDRLQAVSDYFRATYDRTFWGESGEVHPSSFDEFDEGLERAWLNLKRTCELQNKQLSEAERGLLLYSSCCMHSATVEDQSVPSHFVPGSFHNLADQLRVGWHPLYKETFSKEPLTKKVDGDD